MKNLLREIHRRSVWQVLGIYVAASWVVLQVVAEVTDSVGLPEWVPGAAIVLLLIGFPIVLATAFLQHSGHEGAASSPESVGARGADEVAAHGPAAGPEGFATGRSAGRPEPARDEAGTGHRLFTWRNALAGGVLAFSLLFGFAGLLVLLRSPDSPLAPSDAVADEAAPAIAVLPFDVSDSERQEWREEMVYLLSTNLDAVGGLRAIDSRTVLVRWEREVGADARADLETALQVAHATGARHALLGSAIGSGATVRLAADIHEVEGGGLVDRVQVEGSPDSVFALVDRLAVEVLRSVVPSLAGELSGIGLARVTTESPVALKAFLEGEALFSRSEWEACIEPFAEAVEIDSTFALAHYRLSLAYGWAFQDGQRNGHHVQAVRYGARLPERERLLVRANVAYMIGEVHEALRFLEAATGRYPDDPEAWYMLGETLLHLGPQALRDPWESESAFRRTVDLDPGFSPAHHHLVDYGFATLDAELVSRRLEDYRRSGSAETASAFEVASRLAFGDGSPPVSAIDSLTGTRAYVVMYTLAHPSLLELQAAVVDRAMTTGATDLVTGNTFAIWNRLTRGRRAEVLSLVEEIPEPMRGMHLYTARSWGFDVPDAALDQELDRTTGADSLGAPSPTQVVDGGAALLSFAAQAWAADTGRWDDFETLQDRGRALADSLRGAADTVSTIAADRVAGFVTALDGYAAWRRGEPGAALRRMKQAEESLTGWGPNHRLGGPRAANSLLRFWIGELLLELERPEEARLYFESMASTIWEDWPPALERLAQIHDERGDLEKAAEYYARFVELWAAADEELQPRVRAAQARLEEIVRERG